MAIPALTTEQMRKVDYLMIDKYGITLIQMMEDAGRNLARVARRMLDGDAMDRPVIVLAGRGNNGGGGLVAARHLHNSGAWVHVICTHAPQDYENVPAQQLRTLQAMGVPLAWADEGWELPPCDLVIDAIVGYGLRGEPRGRPRDLIQLTNSSAAPVLSLDAPSGLDTSQGALYEPHVQATATLTLALPKRGLLVEPGRSACGDLFLADIGVPPALYEDLGLDAEPIFSASEIVSLHVEDGSAVLADKPFSAW